MIRTAVSRHLFVLIHRWVGLVMALFLLIASLTGSLLAWQDELGAWLRLRSAASKLQKTTVLQQSMGNNETTRIRQITES